MATTPNILIPLQFTQLIDLVKSLPKKEKQQLIEALNQDEPTAVPEWQKKEVRKRIKKYNNKPALLVDEKAALKAINSI